MLVDPFNLTLKFYINECLEGISYKNFRFPLRFVVFANSSKTIIEITSLNKREEEKKEEGKNKEKGGGGEGGVSVLHCADVYDPDDQGLKRREVEWNYEYKRKDR